MHSYYCFRVKEDSLVVVFSLESLITFLFPVSTCVFFTIVWIRLLLLLEARFRNIEFTSCIFEHGIKAVVFRLFFTSHLCVIKICIL